VHRLQKKLKANEELRKTMYFYTNKNKNKKVDYLMVMVVFIRQLSSNRVLLSYNTLAM
jgi:hypothetical protein